MFRDGGSQQPVNIGTGNKRLISAQLRKLFMFHSRSAKGPSFSWGLKIPCHFLLNAPQFAVQWGERWVGSLPRKKPTMDGRCDPYSATPVFNMLINGKQWWNDNFIIISAWPLLTVSIYCAIIHQSNWKKMMDLKCSGTLNVFTSVHTVRF